MTVEGVVAEFRRINPGMSRMAALRVVMTVVKATKRFPDDENAARRDFLEYTDRAASNGERWAIEALLISPLRYFGGESQ